MRLLCCMAVDANLGKTVLRSVAPVLELVLAGPPPERWPAEVARLSADLARHCAHPPELMELARVHLLTLSQRGRELGACLAYALLLQQLDRLIAHGDLHAMHARPELPAALPAAPGDALLPAALSGVLHWMQTYHSAAPKHTADYGALALLAGLMDVLVCGSVRVHGAAHDELRQLEQAARRLYSSIPERRNLNASLSRTKEALVQLFTHVAEHLAAAAARHMHQTKMDVFCVRPNG